MNSIFNFLIIKKVFKVLKKNEIKIVQFLKNSAIRINGEKNIIDIKKGNYKNIKIGIDGNNNIVEIKDNAHIRNLEIILSGDNQKIIIGKNINIGGASLVCCGGDNSIEIGDDCLLASNINLKSCDGHRIYQNDKIINEAQSIKILDHVWIAQDVNILKGVEIESGCVVGINTLVTSGKYPSNSILAGVPAKVIKSDVNWVV